MSGDQIGNLIYLSVLGAALLTWLLVRGRLNLNKMAQHMAVWVLIFFGTVAAIGLWDDVRSTVLPRQSVFGEEGRIELPREQDGHYYITLDVNGAPTRFVVDTGASSMVLTRQDAQRAGLHPEDLVFLSTAMTANGSVQTAPVTLESVALGPIVDNRMPAYVNGGEMDTSLLGMTYLDRFARVEISNGRMVLQR
ncbi:retropepsin-like aspartic protease family protein [Ponticoccus alexandrii]|uniref:TIGR02281 family clan AA aspartic protease n=1 Tax=Ponticoccus alexandrii TaxID=1943633 RepID=A0ABX7F7A0_9RHOB|nr:TIGR02281 family clan AA aspartic protease [Ponticoccus alexandrii]ETA52056.1 aspartyl protease [Rhodobacteraceae bacterium PD-2]QRF66253.1 TIGR02281 family clan AA aspartic protease [Ponticoccus alexandrii]